MLLLPWYLTLAHTSSQIHEWSPLSYILRGGIAGSWWADIVSNNALLIGVNDSVTALALSSCHFLYWSSLKLVFSGLEDSGGRTWALSFPQLWAWMYLCVWLVPNRCMWSVMLLNWTADRVNAGALFCTSANSFRFLAQVFAQGEVKYNDVIRI